MFVLEDLPNQSACLDAKVIRLANATTRTTGECADRGAEMAREETEVEGASDGVIFGRAGGRMPRKDFRFSVINQGLVVALGAKIKSLRNAEADVFGLANARCRLQDGCNNHQRTFGVPLAFTDATEFGGEGGKEAFANFARRQLNRA